jgi:ATP-dependent exoDNAse (exonuclease V) beta subunit
MRRAARIDNTAKDLVKAAKQLGADYLPLNAVIDGILYHRGAVYLVDWKSPKGTLTDDQARLTARGWPVRYISTIDQLQQLLGGTE